MSWTKKLQHVGRKNSAIDEGGGYKGLAIYAAPNVHEGIASTVLAELKNKNAKILILGAGSGAFDERLFDLGYENITTCEFDPEVYKGRFQVLSLDLNEDFGNIGSFDCVIALELIEHLENHYHFLRNCKQLLTLGGKLIISTPNAESSLSRAKFFLRGELQFFSEYEIMHTGHINPVFKKSLIHYAELIGLNCKQISGNASAWSIGQYDTLRQKLLISLLSVLSLVQAKKDKWQISFLLFENR